jgi:hypothetical protein
MSGPMRTLPESVYGPKRALYCCSLDTDARQAIPTTNQPAAKRYNVYKGAPTRISQHTVSESRTRLLRKTCAALAWSIASLPMAARAENTEPSSMEYRGPSVVSCDRTEAGTLAERWALILIASWKSGPSCPPRGNDLLHVTNCQEAEIGMRG